MEYCLEYIRPDYYRRDAIRKSVLAICVVVDLVAIGLIFSAVVDPMVWIAIVLLLCASIILRMIFNRYPIKYIYGVKNDVFFIDKVRPIGSISIAKINLNDIKYVTKASRNCFDDENAMIICDYSCQNDVYMIKSIDKCVIIPLDTYMYTLLES